METISRVRRSVSQTMARDRVWSFAHHTTHAPDISHNILLYVEELTVSFDGFRALNNLNLYIETGELRCLIGANGAGKTTLMDVITGKTAYQQGKIFYGQTIDLATKTEPQIAELGIGRKFQKPGAFDALTVWDNVRLSLRGKKSLWQAMATQPSPEQLYRIDDILGIVGLQAQAKQLAGKLSHGQKQWLEIGMLLAADPKLLLIDEPVAGMTPQETERTAELLTGLAGKHTLIVVEHDMAFVKSIAQTITVLHQGSVLAEGKIESIQNNSDVIQAYLG